MKKEQAPENVTQGQPAKLSNGLKPPFKKKRRRKSRLVLFLIGLLALFAEKLCNAVAGRVATDLGTGLLDVLRNLTGYLVAFVASLELIRAVYLAQVFAACLMLVKLQMVAHPERWLLTIFSLANAAYYAPVIAATDPVPITNVIAGDLRELAFLLMSSVLLRAQARRRGHSSFPIAMGVALLLGVLVLVAGDDHAQPMSFLVSMFGAFAAASYGWCIRAELSNFAKLCGCLYVLALLTRPLTLDSDVVLINQIYYSAMLLKWIVVEEVLRNCQRSAWIRPRTGASDAASDDLPLRVVVS
jgi:hypothetical protein